MIVKQQVIRSKEAIIGGSIGGLIFLVLCVVLLFKVQTYIHVSLILTEPLHVIHVSYSFDLIWFFLQCGFFKKRQPISSSTDQNTVAS